MLLAGLYIIEMFLQTLPSFLLGFLLDINNKLILQYALLSNPNADWNTHTQNFAISFNTLIAVTTGGNFIDSNNNNTLMVGYANYYYIPITSKTKTGFSWRGYNGSSFYCYWILII